MPEILKGRIWKFGDDINTDLIFPQIAFLKPQEEQPKYCFYANRPGWSEQVQQGDIIVAGKNFGTGSGRPIGKIFTALGVAGILAETFNGLALRNCINFGMSCLPCSGITDAFDDGDLAEVNTDSGLVRNVTKGTTVQGEPLPQALQEIVDAGGVMPLLRREGYLS